MGLKSNTCWTIIIFINCLFFNCTISPDDMRKKIFLEKINIKSGYCKSAGPIFQHKEIKTVWARVYECTFNDEKGVFVAEIEQPIAYSRKKFKGKVFSKDGDIDLLNIGNCSFWFRPVLPVTFTPIMIKGLNSVYDKFSEFIIKVGYCKL